MGIFYIKGSVRAYVRKRSASIVVLVMKRQNTMFLKELSYFKNYLYIPWTIWKANTESVKAVPQSIIQSSLMSVRLSVCPFVP